MRYYIIAGEASGDLHASNLMKALRQLDPDANFRCWGGALMQDQGGVLVRNYKDLAFMGFLEVVLHLPTILKNFSFCEDDIASYKPDVVILVDYPGFNLRVAKMAFRKHFRVFYYISPQLWAWRSSRVKQIRQFVERMFVILPFEKHFYEMHHYEVDYEGHPLLDVLTASNLFPTRSLFLERNGLPDKPIIALLPGSRRMEIGKMLNIMLSVTKSFPGHQFVVAGAPSIEAGFYRDLASEREVAVVTGQTYELLSHAQAALVTSGTATLETALMDVPEIVCYKGNSLSYLIARQLVKVKFISLVNLILDEQLVPELIQAECSSRGISEHLDRILNDAAERQRIRDGYKALRLKLGGPGASQRVASRMIQYLKTN